ESEDTEKDAPSYLGRAQRLLNGVVEMLKIGGRQDRTLNCEMLRTTGEWCLRVGAPAEAVPRLERAREMARQAQEGEELLLAEVAGARARLATGNVAAAGNHARAALDAARGRHRPLEILQALVLAGEVAARAGRHTEAEPLLREALSVYHVVRRGITSGS